MSKVTRKYQISIPKPLADAHGIRPGDDLDWQDAGGGLRLVTDNVTRLSIAERLRLFDAAERRRKSRQRREKVPPQPRAAERGWTRAALYDDRADRH